MAQSLSEMFSAFKGIMHIHLIINKQISIDNVKNIPVVIIGITGDNIPTGRPKPYP